MALAHPIPIGITNDSPDGVVAHALFIQSNPPTSTIRSRRPVPTVALHEADLVASLTRAVVPERNRLILSRLSPSERQVATQVITGRSNKEIAGVLERSEATVKNQLSTILKKLRLQSRSQLIAVLLL